MRSLPLVLAASLIGLTAAATPASAQYRGAKMFNQADVNKDGTVTKAEYDAARGALFAKMDANGDGTIEISELRAWMRAMPARIRDARFKRLDANSDGKISADEYVARRKASFDKIDTNSDGAVDKAEFDKAFEGFRNRMRARMMKRREMRRGGGHRGHRMHRRGHGGKMRGQRFERRLDLNGDGKITRVEFDTLGLMIFLRLDRDGDNAISKDEARKARRHMRRHMRGHGRRHQR